MINFNLIKINNPNNSLKELLNKQFNNVLYLTRDDLYFSRRNKAILDISIHDFMNFSSSSNPLLMANFIIFVDDDWCYIFKSRYGKTGLYRTETLKIELINGTNY